MARQSTRTVVLRLVTFAALFVLCPVPSPAQGNAASVIPTLDPLGLLGLAAVIGGAGLVTLRARRRSK